MESADAFGLTFLSFLSRMFQCVKCEFATSDKEKVVLHYLQEHLKPSQVPFVCEQCRLRAPVRHAMINHWCDQYQAPMEEVIDDNCFGTLQPLKEKEIFKIKYPWCQAELTWAGKPQT